MTLVALLMLMAGSSLVWRRPSGMLFIFHFTPRQLRRLRLEITRSYRISSYAISNIPPRPIGARIRCVQMAPQGPTLNSRRF